MKVIIAEKPSVARDLASFLKASSKREGYFEGAGYQVTWALGHLVELQEPHDYDPAMRKWSLHTLPFIPTSFELKLRGDDGARHQFSIVKRLFRAADSIICATDAGREGELIFRYILSLTQCETKPAERLWLSSLTPDAIRTAFRSLRPLADYDNLYAAAKCRSEADWIVGLNATRNYTVRFGTSGILWSLGRVQTPVLAMITRRDDEIRTFISQPFWELLTKYRDVTFRYTGDRFDQQLAADRLLAKVKPHPLTIGKVQRKPETSAPPQLYDLTELQRDINRRYGLSAADTLASAQSLYESKLITYPRTDSRYLSADMQKEVPATLKKLKAIKPDQIAKLDLSKLVFGGRIINSAKVTDHHAIIPTGNVPTGLRDRDQKVFDAIVIRFIAAFYPPCVKEITTVDAAVKETPFRARGVRVVSAGWTELYPRKSSENESEDEQSLPEFIPKETGPHWPFIKSGQTSPPKHFTENTLLGAMDTAGKLVDEAELREALKEKGLGTPATRAAIIETLLRRQYISRDKKNLLATDLGRYLISRVRDDHLKSPEMTGEWESKLNQIEAGKLSASGFMNDIAEYTRRIIRSSDNVSIDSERIGDCPRCGKPIIAGKQALGCSDWRAGCKFVLQPVYRERELERRSLRELLQHGVTSDSLDFGDGRKVILGLAPGGAIVEIPLPQGNEQSANAPTAKRTTAKRPAARSTKTSVSAKPAKKTTRKTSSRTPAKTSSRTSTSTPEKVDSTATDLGGCPLCDAPVIEQLKSFSCSRWSDGCSLTVRKTISGKKITASMVQALLRDGKTGSLEGFKSKAGKPFSARLELREGKTELVFDP